MSGSKHVQVTGGSGVTVTTTAGRDMSHVYTTVNQKITASSASEDLKAAILELSGAIQALPPTADAAQVGKMGDNLSTLTNKIANPETDPEDQRKWYELSVDGLKKAATAVGQVAAPVIAAAFKVSKLLGLA